MWTRRRQLTGEVTQQTNELSEPLASTCGIGNYRAGQRPGSAFPNVSISADEELVADVVPTLRRARLECVGRTDHALRRGVVVGRRGVMHQQELCRLDANRPPWAEGPHPRHHGGRSIVLGPPPPPASPLPRSIRRPDQRPRSPSRQPASRQQPRVVSGPHPAGNHTSPHPSGVLVS
jgi:hypothetical protein